MKNPDLSAYSNTWFEPGGNSLTRVFWFFTNALIFNSYIFPINTLKVFLLRLFGAKIGKGVIIKPSVNIKYPWNLNIGDHTWIGEKVWIDNLVKISIGDNCCISQSAILFCGNHNFKSIGFDLMVLEIKLQNGSWVGANSTVCPGVTLKENSILTAGSTATQDLDINSICQGNPAKKIKERVIV